MLSVAANFVHSVRKLNAGLAGRCEGKFLFCPVAQNALKTWEHADDWTPTQRVRFSSSVAGAKRICISSKFQVLLLLVHT